MTPPSTAAALARPEGPETGPAVRQAAAADAVADRAPPLANLPTHANPMPRAVRATVRPRTDTPAPARRASDRLETPHTASALHPWPAAPATLLAALAVEPHVDNGSSATTSTTPAIGADGPHTPAHGLPQDRHARVAAARALIELQQAFRQALGLLDGLPYRRQLERQIELARDPAELWLLRRSVLPPLQALGGCAERTIWQLERSIARSVAQHAPPMA